MLVAMPIMRNQKISVLALEEPSNASLSCVHASRIALSGTYGSELESKQCGTSAVTPKDIVPVGELVVGLGLGEKIKIFLFP